MQIDDNLSEEQIILIMAETYTDRQNMVKTKKSVSSIFQKYPYMNQFSGSMVKSSIIYTHYNITLKH